MAKKRSEAQWRQWVADFETSGETQFEFCRTKSVSLGTFRYWLYKVRRQAVGPRFVEVVPQVPALLTPAGTIVVGEIRIEFGELPPADYVGAVVQAIGDKR